MQEVPQSSQNIVNFRPQSFSSLKNQTQNINNCSFVYFQQQGNKYQNSGSEQQINLQQAPISQLLQHQSSNDNSIIGSNICSECNKKFLKQAHLLRHINERHQNNRSFVCKQPNCGKSFKRDSHLRRHMISHTHQKSYKCQKCIMAFGYKHHLDRHVKAVHEKQLLRCQSCSLSFVKKKAFIKHLQKIHPSEKSRKTGQSNTETLLIKASQKQPILQQKFKCQKTKKIIKSQGKKISRKGAIKYQAKRSLRCSQNIQIQQPKQNNSQDSLFLDESVDLEKANQEKVILLEQVEIERIEYSNRNEGIQQKLTLKSTQKDDKELLFRCIHPQCVSAFNKFHELSRHLKQRHV